MRSLFLIILILIFPVSVKAYESFAEGESFYDLNKDGAEDRIEKTWHETGNAHGFYHIVFFVDHKPVLIEKNGVLRDHIETVQGADCVLVDYRFDNKQGILLETRRDMGQNFADTSDVSFIRYKLMEEEGQYIFRPIEERKAHKQYCDVSEAWAEIE